MKIGRRGLCTLSIAILAWAGPSASLARADDLDTLFNRYHRNFLSQTRALNETEVRSLMSGLGAGGTWTDVDLSLQEQVNWTPRVHLDRLAQMAKAFVSAGHALQGDAQLAADFSRALDAYVKADPVSTNWWYNEIGAQLSLAPAMYLMKARLTAVQKAGTDSIMARSWRSKARTGENLVWISRITAWRAVNNRDEKLLTDALAAIASTIIISAAEGIQPDYSFHQHGAQLYSGGYGNGFATDGASTASETGGTRYGFAPDKLAILADYLLQGQRWMVRGNNFDHSVCGREITRAGAGNATPMATAAERLAPLVPSSAAALTAFAGGIRSTGGSSVEGARLFWRSEYLAHHRKGGFISLRMASKRLGASELVNQEGLLSQYLADGATLFYRSGKEYDQIFPVWDWCRIPGVTAAHAASPPAMKNPAPGVGEFAGGASDGKYAVAAFAYAKLNVTASKAWFFFDREMLALGAGLSSSDTGSLQTSVNQCLSVGTHRSEPAALGPAPLPVPAGTALWVHHDRIGYVFLPGAGGEAPDLRVVNAPASGAWSRINASQSAASVTKNVFSLYIDHGKKPAAGSYRYAVLMDVAPEEVAAYAQDPAIKVLSNTPSLQAARHKALGITEAVFHAAGQLDVEGRFTLAANRAGALLVREEANQLVLAVADPARGTADMQVTVGLKLSGPGAVWSEAAKTTVLTLPLPKGDSAGATTVRAFAAAGAALRPASPSGGMRLSARAIPGAHGRELRITFVIPRAGSARLLLLDAAGRELAGFALGRAVGGTHAWTAPEPVSAAGARWVILEWQGKRLSTPVATAVP